MQEVRKVDTDQKKGPVSMLHGFCPAVVAVRPT